MSWFFILFWFTTFITLLQHFLLVLDNQYAACASPIGWGMVLLLGSMFMKLCGWAMMGSEKYLICGTLMFFFFGFANSVMAYVNFGFLINNLYKSPKCIPKSTSSFDPTVISVLTACYTLLYCMLISTLVKRRLVQSQRNEMYEEYPKFLQPGFDFEAFMTNYESAIRELKVQDKDIGLLNDFCTSNFQKQSENESQSDCVICLSEFEEGENIVLHPGCDHRFHKECLYGWLLNPKEDTANTCPTCRNPTRLGMIQHIQKHIESGKPLPTPSAPPTLSSTSETGAGSLLEPSQPQPA